MGVIKNYFKHQFQRQMFGLEYEDATDFYLSAFQKNRTILPLMCIRGVLFSSCLAIVVVSFILPLSYIPAAYWPIFLTHWGLVLITLASGFAFGVSARAYFKGPIDATFGLPWYIKVYWILYSIAIPVALFITIFYWTFLSGENEHFEVSLVLDVLTHATNSALVLILLVTARHPINLLHFIYPILVAIVYALFSLIYYFAGGTDSFGNPYIYPVLDWNQPGPAFVIIALAAVMITVLHCLVALLTSGRDALSKSCIRDTKNFNLQF